MPQRAPRSVLTVLLVRIVAAQEERDSIPLKDWAVNFEQVRSRVAETRASRIAQQSLHPSPNAVPSAASHFVTVVPCRLLDTRNPNGPFGGPSFTPGLTRTLPS